MRFALLCLLILSVVADDSTVKLVLAGSRSPKNNFYFKNGYDPLLNMMTAANGAVQGYIDNFARNRIYPGYEYEPVGSTQGVDIKPSDQVIGKINDESDGDVYIKTYTHTEGQIAQATATPAPETNPGTEETPAPGTAEETDATKPETSTNADEGQTGDEDSSSSSGNSKEEIFNGPPTQDQQQQQQQPLNDQQQQLNQDPADATTPFAQAPFRVVDDDATIDVNEMKKHVSDLVSDLQKRAKNPTVLSATNKKDEDDLKAIMREKGKADESVLKKIQEQEQAAASTADPYEISILHKIGEKVRVIQDAVTRQAAGITQQLPPETIVLKNLVSSVKAMRKQAEEQYQNEPMRVFAKDEKRLRKMEKLLKKMTELMNDRSLSPKQFNQLSAVYRDKLNQIRRKID